MRILTIAQMERLKENGSPLNRDKDHAPVVRLFIPMTNCVWLISEIDPEYTNIAFGLCDLGMGFPELGSVDLDELMEVKSPRGLKVECDKTFRGLYPMSVYAAAARYSREIVTADCILQRYGKLLPPRLLFR